eukprot:gene16323-18507_t
MSSLQISDLDILTRDKKTIDVHKVILKLWENKKNMKLLVELVHILCKFVDEKRVFAELEFFLPQLAHLTIHSLHHETCSVASEQLLMMISQTSIHAALQLSFIFVAAMEDYQPEIKGHRNPACNPFLFKRCARLLEDVERAVIYGSHTVTAHEKSIIEVRRSQSNAGTPKSELETMKSLKREEMAATLARTKSFMDGQLSGDLFYKRIERKSAFHSKPWKSCYFIVDKRVLLCYKDPYSVQPKRAMHLQNCRVIPLGNHPKYGDTVFEVINDSLGVHFLLRAADEPGRQAWINVLQSEINGAPPVLVTDAVSNTDEDIPATEIKIIPAIPQSEMTPIQRKRFAFYRQLRIFITNMTNICERLRFKERPLRKFFLKHDMKELVIPPFAYVPLCSSLDSYSSILRALPKECHAFSTKARCPALMLFEIEQHNQQVDVATFLGVELERYAEAEIVQERLEIVQTFTGTVDESEEISDNNTGESVNVPRKPSKFMGLMRGSTDSYWAPEGSGLRRCEEAGIQLNLSIGRAMTVTENTTNSTTPTSESGAANNSTTGALGETFSGKSERVRVGSPYGHLPSWKLGGLIAKSNDDVRQEVYVMQMITFYEKVLRENNVPVWIHTYRIMSTSKTTGLIELIPNAVSLDGLKKKSDYPGSLRGWYEQAFGGPNSPQFKRAIDNYVSSMAAYSIIAYLLAIKDRHNGNIMIDKEGHVIHIDFGFVFGLAPGKQASMEKAPWKLNKEMAEVMGGWGSELFEQYKQKCIQTFTVLRKYSNEAITLMQIMQHCSNFP